MSEGIGLNPADWDILYSTGVGSHPDGITSGWRVSLNGSDELDYMQRKCAQKIRDVIKDSGSTFVAAIEITGTDWKAPEGGAAAITFLMRKGSDLTQANNRLWCRSDRRLLTPGSYTWTVPVDRSKWSNVDGQTPSSSAWNNMLSNMDYVGMTFGGTFFGHGVKCQNGGSVSCLSLRAN